MNLKRAVYAVASLGADALAVAIAAIRPAGVPGVRLLRLARLRSLARGRVPATTQFDGRVEAAGTVRLTLGEYCRLGNGVFFETVDEGRIELGSHVTLNRGCVLVSYARIAIGDGTLVGEYTSIRDANHGTAVGTPMRLQPHDTAPIVIGEDVWIGRGVAILKGVTIGPGAVVAANSVVTKDVPPMAVVAGAPAAIVKRRGEGQSAQGEKL